MWVWRGWIEEMTTYVGLERVNRGDEDEMTTCVGLDLRMEHRRLGGVGGRPEEWVEEMTNGVWVLGQKGHDEHEGKLTCV